MDPQKIYKFLDSAEHDLAHAIETLRQASKTAAFEGSGVIAQKVPVDIQSVIEAVARIQTGTGVGTISYVKDLVIGANGSDFIDSMQQRPAAQPAAPQIPSQPSSAILGEKSLKKFYKDSLKEYAEPNGLNFDALCEDPAFGCENIDDDPMLDCSDDIYSQTAAQLDGIYDDPEMNIDMDAVANAPTFNGDCGDLVNQMHPEDMSMSDIRQMMVEPASAGVSGERMSVDAISGIGDDMGEILNDDYMNPDTNGLD